MQKKVDATVASRFNVTVGRAATQAPSIRPTWLPREGHDMNKHPLIGCDRGTWDFPAIPTKIPDGALPTQAATSPRSSLQLTTHLCTSEDQRSKTKRRVLCSTRSLRRCRTLRLPRASASRSSPIPTPNDLPSKVGRFYRYFNKEPHRYGANTTKQLKDFAFTDLHTTPC